MLLPSLIRLIETHADDLVDQVVRAVQTDPRTAFLHEVSEAELKRRAYDLYGNLGRWLGEKSEADIEATYRENGYRRFQEGVPLSELVHTLSVMKQYLWNFVRKNDLPETATNLYSEEQLEMMVGQFFDKALYHAVRGYEEAWLKEAPTSLLAGTAAPGMTGVTMSIARVVLSELQARRVVLDSDSGLRGLTLAVTLEPHGKVRSITVQPESVTEWPRS